MRVRPGRPLEGNLRSSSNRRAQRSRSRATVLPSTALKIHRSDILDWSIARNLPDNPLRASGIGIVRIRVGLVASVDGAADGHLVDVAVSEDYGEGGGEGGEEGGGLHCEDSD